MWLKILEGKLRESGGLVHAAETIRLFIGSLRSPGSMQELGRNGLWNTSDARDASTRGRKLDSSQRASIDREGKKTLKTQLAY